MSRLHDQIMNLPLAKDWDVGLESATERLAYKIGHRDVRHAAAELAVSEPDRVRLLEQALRKLLDYIDGETCTHEETYRGGVIWTICRQCDMKWADDRGGFVPHVDAPAVAAARTLIEREPS